MLHMSTWPPRPTQPNRWFRARSQQAISTAKKALYHGASFLLVLVALYRDEILTYACSGCSLEKNKGPCKSQSTTQLGKRKRTVAYGVDQWGSEIGSSLRSLPRSFTDFNEGLWSRARWLLPLIISTHYTYWFHLLYILRTIDPFIIHLSYLYGVPK